MLANYCAAIATAPVTAPPGREWIFKLADALGCVLDALDDDQADEDEDEPFCYTCGSPVGIFHSFHVTVTTRAGRVVETDGDRDEVDLWLREFRKAERLALVVEREYSLAEVNGGIGGIWSSPGA